uniref:Uncharacterized protein n=1 Tax=Strigamia maritima TaxID=126957 RepID=T1IVH9_STRMM
MIVVIGDFFPSATCLFDMAKVERKFREGKHHKATHGSDDGVELFLACEDDDLSPVQIEAHDRATRDYDEALQNIAILRSKKVKIIESDNANLQIPANSTVVSASSPLNTSNYAAFNSVTRSDTCTVSAAQPTAPVVELPKLNLAVSQSQLIIQNTMAIATQPQPTVMQPASYKLLLDARTGLIIGTMPNDNQARPATTMLPTTQTIAFVPLPASMVPKPSTPVTASTTITSGSIHATYSKKVTTLTEREVDANNLEVNLGQFENQQRLPSQYPSLTIKSVPQRLASLTVVQNKKAELDKTMNEVVKLKSPDLVKWMFEHGLFHIEQKCVVHRVVKMQLVFDNRESNDNSGGYKWQCGECMRTLPIQHLSFFESLGYGLLTMLRIIYFWACNEDVQKVLRETKVSACFLRSVYSLLRSICGSKVKSLMKLGGSDTRTVEVSLVLLKDTCIHASQLFFGCIYERSTGMVALRAFANKTDSSTEDFVNTYVDSYSVINTDKTTNDQGSGILNAKAYLKERVIPMFGNVIEQLQMETIQSFLHELMWREKFGTNPYNAFNNILLHIKQHYGTGTTSIKTSSQPLKMPVVSVLSESARAAPQSILPKSGNSIIRAELNKPIKPSSAVCKIQLPTEPKPVELSKVPILLEDYYYAWKSGITRAESLSGVQPQYKFKCCVCKKLLDNNIKMMKHLSAHIESIKQRNMDLSDVSQCKHCFREFDTPYVMQCHIEDVHLNNSSSLKCRICDQAFQYEESLIKHMVSTHTAVEMPYSCEVCKYRCSMYKTLVDHFHQVHNDTNYIQCHYCLKVFSVKFSAVRQIGLINNFWTHVYKHQTKSLNRKCTACSLMFVGRNEMTLHRLQDHVTYKDKPGVFKFNTNDEKGVKIYMKEPPLRTRVNFRGRRKKTVAVQSTKPKNMTSKYSFASSPRLLGLQCLECKFEMELPSHFMKSWCCSQCRYVTSCGKAFANHMIIWHSKARKRETIYNPVRLPCRMYCICGFSESMGNSMARHLAHCGKVSCYRTPEAARRNYFLFSSHLWSAAHRLYIASYKDMAVTYHGEQNQIDHGVCVPCGDSNVAFGPPLTKPAVLRRNRTARGGKNRWNKALDVVEVFHPGEGWFMTLPRMNETRNPSVSLQNYIAMAAAAMLRSRVATLLQKVLQAPNSRPITENLHTVTKTGGIVADPEQIPLGIVKIILTVLPGLYIGATLTARAMGIDEEMEVKCNSHKSTPKTGKNDRECQMDSGFKAWMVCFASFWTNGTIFGIINSTGVLYVELKEKYKDTENVTVLAAIVGSLCIGITFLVSPVAGILTDRFGVRKIALVGSVISAIGMFLSSFVESLVLYFLTFGILLGSGLSLTYTPSLVILGHYFKRRIGLVNGIVTFGSSLFTVAFPFMLEYLFQVIGLEATLQVLSAMLAVLVLCSLVFTPQLPVEKSPERTIHSHQSWMDKCRHFCTKIVNINLWKNKRYRIWALTIPVALFGYFVPYVHLVAYVKEVYPTKSGEMLVSCIGITSGIGRIVFGRLADFPRVNRVFLQQARLSFFCIGVLTIILPHVHYYEALIVVCLGLGLFDGCFISLLGPIAIDLTGRQGASQAIGFLLGLCSIPLTLGPPIAGWIRVWQNSYQPAFIYAGIPPIVGSLVMILVSRDKSLTSTAEPQSLLDESTCLTSGKSHVLNPFKRPKDSELPVLQTCQKVDGRINLIHKMKQPLYKKTARESKADPFDILRSIPDFCHLQELPSTPTSLIQKDPKVAQAMAIGEKLKNLETAKDFVVAKREIFLIQYLIGVKKDELMRIKNLQISEGRKLDKAELRLETDAINFDRFLKNSDHETMDCLKQVEIESKLKWDKITEIQKLNVQIVTIRNKLRKLEEIITEYKSYEKFLTNVAPQEWKDRKARERQIAAAKLSRMGKQSEYSILDVAIRQRSASITSGKGYKKIRKRPSKRFDLGGDADNSSDSGSVGLPHSDPPSEDEEEKADIYFTKPQQLLDIFDEMEERSIRMIQKSEDNEDAIYELRASFRLTKRKMQVVDYFYR